MMFNIDLSFPIDPIGWIKLYLRSTLDYKAGDQDSGPGTISY